MAGLAQTANNMARAGAITVVQICSACHSLRYVRYADLLALGVSKQDVDALRGDNDMLMHIAAQTPESAAKEAYGVVPPDLSLMAMAREGGADYIYRMLTGFYQRQDGTTNNRAYPNTRMPDILGISVANDPQSLAQIKQTAHNVAAFLQWAADPKASERITIGYYVMAYLVVLTLLLYLLKRQIWRDVAQ